MAKLISGLLVDDDGALMTTSSAEGAKMVAGFLRIPTAEGSDYGPIVTSGGGGGGGGSVSSVNLVAPDGAGNVTLTPVDIGAVPSSTAAAQVYTTTNVGAQGMILRSIGMAANSLVQRGADNEFSVGLPASPSPTNAVPKSYVDGLIAKPSSFSATGSGSRIPIKDGAADTWVNGGIVVNESPVSGSIAARGAGARLRVGDGVAADDAVTKAQLDARALALTPATIAAKDGSGNLVALPYSGNPGPGTVALRRSGGQLAAADATVNNEAFTLGQAIKPSTYGLTVQGQFLIRDIADGWATAGVRETLTSGTVIQRTGTGQALVADATNANEAATLGQLNARLTLTQRSAINALTGSSTAADIVAALKA